MINTNFLNSAALGASGSVNTIEVFHSDPTEVVSDQRNTILDTYNGSVRIMERFFYKSPGTFTFKFIAKKSDQV
jgi:hypothetical protein